MSSVGISFSGLASGLDTQAIISALLAVERRPLQALEAKKSSFQSRKGLFGDLEEMLNTLRSKADGLRTTTDFLAYRVDLENEDYFTASVGNTASPGTYRVHVNQLAAAQVNTSNGYADRNAAIDNGTLAIDIDGTTHFVDVNEGTLQGVANAINSAGIDVAAEVVDTGNPTDPFQLVVRGRNTGSAGAFSISLDSGGASLNDLVNELNDDNNQVSDPTDAQVEINGIQFTRSSNTIGDAIQGVTLNLKGESAGNTVDLTISPDASATADKVQDFVDAYNEIIDFVEGQNQVGEEGQTSSPLFGDSTLRSIRSTLRTIVGSTFDTGNTAYSMFAQIGVESDTKGRLSLNRSEFEEALTADATAVGRLFTDQTNGIATRLYERIDPYTDTVDGLIKTRKDGYDSLIRQAQRRIDDGERRLELTETRLTAKFAALESLLSQLQSQGSALSGINPVTSP